MVEKIDLVDSIPSFAEIKRYNNTDEYRGYEYKVNLSDNLYLRISVQNEKVIFQNCQDKSNILYMSLCTGNDFPIWNISYDYAYGEKAYDLCIKQLINAIDRFIQSLTTLKCKL